jgi:hypothetical protein
MAGTVPISEQERSLTQDSAGGNCGAKCRPEWATRASVIGESIVKLSSTICVSKRIDLGDKWQGAWLRISLCTGL